MDIPNFSGINVLAAGGIAAALAAVASGWRQIRAIAVYLSGLFILQKTVHGNLCYPVIVYIRAHYKRVPSGISTFQSKVLQLDNNSISSHVPFDMPNKNSVIYGPHGWFLVSADGTLNLKSLRGFSNPRALIQAALEYDEVTRKADQQIGHGNFYVNKIMGTAGDPAAQMEMYGGNNLTRKSGEVSADPPELAASSMSSSEIWTNPQIGIDKSFMYPESRYVANRKQRDPFQGLFYGAEVHALTNRLKTWFSQGDWYAERGIPWRTGVLLEGPGGTGKSSYARAIAELLGIPLNQFYLSTLTDREFVREWDKMRSPCIVTLEDFDNVFHGRESVTHHKSLNFDCVLNQISGIGSLNGVLLIVTTNHIEHIDPAMGRLENGKPTRPGRIDHIVHLGICTEDTRRKIANYTLNGWDVEILEALVSSNPETTPAQFQSICIERALSELAKS